MPEVHIGRQLLERCCVRAEPLTSAVPRLCPPHPLCSKRGVLLDITSLPDVEQLSQRVGPSPCIMPVACCCPRCGDCIALDYGLSDSLCQRALRAACLMAGPPD